MHTKKLAVVIPVYNERFIEKTLQGLYDQDKSWGGMHLFVVNNGSTDNTRELVDRFTAKHKDFPITVLDEPQKGTGAACDTGFRYAIKKRYPVIARTDGDSVPLPNWTSKIYDIFYGPNPPRMLGGQTIALHDEYHKAYDTLLIPLVARTSPYILSLQHFNPNHSRRAIGANMATTAETYLAVGGFPRSSINELDEDVAYSTKVADKFGKKSIRIDWSLKVRTSSRRTRVYGVVGIMLYYLFPSKRRGNIDAR
jgi:glycosyltransferase involved in cell wall biosynthesis